MIFPPSPPPPLFKVYIEVYGEKFLKNNSENNCFPKQSHVRKMLRHILWIYEIKVMDLLDKVLFKNYYFIFTQGKNSLKNTFRV